MAKIILQYSIEVGDIITFYDRKLQADIYAQVQDIRQLPLVWVETTDALRKRYLLDIRDLKWRAPESHGLEVREEYKDHEPVSYVWQVGMKDIKYIYKDEITRGIKN